MPITFKKAGQEAVTLDNISFKGVALDKVTFKKAGQEAITVFEKVSTKTLKAGTYQFVKNLQVPQKNISEQFACKGYYLTAQNTYGNLSSIVSIISAGSVFEMNFADENHNMYDSEIQQWYTESTDDNTYNATDTSKLRSIILESDQQVSADFYEWAITGGNLQAVLVVPMSFSTVSGNSDTLEYYNIKSTKPTAGNYEYKIVGNSNGAVLTSKAGTVLSSLNLPFYCTPDGGIWKCIGKLWYLTVSGGLELRYRVIGTDGTDEFSDAISNGDGCLQYSFTTSDPFAYSFNISAFVVYND